MASQQTPMAERAAQQNNLPEEMIAAGFQPYYQPYPGQQQTIAPPPLETSKRAEFTRLGFFGAALLLGIIGLGLSLSSLGGSDISVAIAALPAVCFHPLFFKNLIIENTDLHYEYSPPSPRYGVWQRSSPEQSGNSRGASTPAPTSACASSSG